MNQADINRRVVVVLALGISALFLAMIAGFLEGIFLAGLFAALFNPLYQWVRRRVGGRDALASVLTVLLALLFVVVPAILLAITVVGQALSIAGTARPWLQEVMAEPGTISELFSALPFYDTLLPYRETVLQYVGDLVGGLSSAVVNLIQSATVGTANMIGALFIMLYTMVFFLIDGDTLIKRILYYLPLDDRDEFILLDRFTSVGRATLRGTVVIGVLQGTLAGIAMAIAGVPSATLWAVVMMFTSVVPGVGTALVWVPAVIYLLILNQWVPAIGLLAFCAGVVGTIDNLLRPRLVGGDTQMHELMIFFSTLGGLSMFGFSGFIIGPIIAALFVSVWEIYGLEFRNWLPDTAFKTRAEREQERAMLAAKAAEPDAGDGGATG